jgi:hypothetical protein
MHICTILAGKEDFHMKHWKIIKMRQKRMNFQKNEDLQSIKSSSYA